VRTTVRLLIDTGKKECRIIGVQRLPTAHLLPIVAPTDIRHVRLKEQLRTKNTSLLVAEEGTRPIEQFGHIVARPRSSRCRTSSMQRIRQSIIALAARHGQSGVTTRRRR
jgi:hypothetical protein